MIFVTVGTHEQPFNRLIECIDNLKRDGVIQEEVIIQTGYSTYEPKNCTWEKFFAYKKMLDMVSKARIVITHGGPSSFIMPLQIGKVPIVVPRKRVFNEHVNDHQVDFVKEVSERMKNIITVIDTMNLGNALQNYDNIVSGMNKNNTNNNTEFNVEFSQIIDELFGR